MERACPKRKKTKIFTDTDVKRYLQSETDGNQKNLVSLPKVPEEWSSALTLSLYHNGYTLTLGNLGTTEIIAYDENQFLNFIENGEIPSEMIAILPHVEMISENKIVIDIHDFRGFSSMNSTSLNTLDHPIQTRQILTRNIESMILELYHELGDHLSLSHIQQIENYLLMMHCAPLCLDVSTEVFRINEMIHTNLNMLNDPTTRSMILKAQVKNNEQLESLEGILDIEKESKPSKHLETNIDAETKKEELVTPKQPIPNLLHEILELCNKRVRNQWEQNNRPQMVMEVDSYQQGGKSTPNNVEVGGAAAGAGGYPPPIHTKQHVPIKPAGPRMPCTIHQGDPVKPPIISPQQRPMSVGAVHMGSSSISDKVPQSFANSQYAVSPLPMSNKTSMQPPAASIIGNMMTTQPISHPMPQQNQAGIMQKSMGAVDAINQSTGMIMQAHQYPRNYSYHAIPTGYDQQYVAAAPGRQVLPLPLPPQQGHPLSAGNIPQHVRQIRPGVIQGGIRGAVPLQPRSGMSTAVMRPGNLTPQTPNPTIPYNQISGMYNQY